ncbi:MAG: hypothetical protein K8R91_05795 [Phycisphaerae bacterium]|nr:hypothetical protein [Phycisphaerae bacterium]
MPTLTPTVVSTPFAPILTPDSITVSGILESSKFGPIPAILYAAETEDNEQVYRFRDIGVESEDENYFRFEQEDQLGPANPSASREGGYVAFLSREDPMGVDKELIIYHLPSRQVILRQPVFANWLRLKLAEQLTQDPIATYSGDLMATLKSCGAFRWSPDSRFLAFTAAIEGHSSDIYLFDTQTHQVTRMTDGPTEADIMAWSPDGQWLLHTAWQKGRIDMDSTPLRSIRSIWAISISSGDVIEIEEISWESELERVIGWIDDDSVLVSSWSGMNSHVVEGYSVRRLDLTAAESEAVFLGPFEHIAFDPASHTIAFASGDYLDQYPGIHTLALGEEIPQQIMAGRGLEIDWNSVSGLFRAVMWGENENEVVYFDPAGSITTPHPLEEIGIPVISPDASLAVVAGSDESETAGLFLYSIDDDAWVAAFLHGYIYPDLTGYSVHWNPDSTGFWILTSPELFHFSVVEEELRLIDENFMGSVPYPGYVFAFP